mmetsp:Transcript_13607/g.33458  ORF Transcript_13607/g.33458 Transcript_13607/m.33458 type:complete len:355 (-) Transcript_13607:2268-3332(-)|eukprot:CAMPEP_0178982574 /NCGR_PEP_ID=MMETSP0795-20121207/575_1 /TAXON_ID=88552 /ORGANISM="Amoebophrya sp., Strain Ameob2" /LENGTH=354 /DNA_ID=CAMNT_0020673241 /DNA_START=297 /DNA_END=1361 /DNA_ORIENTATION=+
MERSTSSSSSRLPTAAQKKKSRSATGSSRLTVAGIGFCTALGATPILLAPVVAAAPQQQPHAQPQGVKASFGSEAGGFDLFNPTGALRDRAFPSNELVAASELSTTAPYRAPERLANHGVPNSPMQQHSSGQAPRDNQVQPAEDLSFRERVRRRAEEMNMLRFGMKSLPSPDPFVDSRDLQGIQAQYCLISAAGLTDHLRNCLQTCHVLDDVIEPRFTQFESFCVESAADPLWPDPCYDFFECVLGCKITQEITKGKTIDTIKPGDREDYFGRIDPGNVEAEQRCLIEKCRSYCVRQRLGTCHEMGYIRACEAAQRGQYLPCDVNCNSAVGRKGAAGIVVGAVFAAAGLWFVAM